MAKRVQGATPGGSGDPSAPVVRQRNARPPASGPEAPAAAPSPATAVRAEKPVGGHLPTSGPYRVYETTVFSERLHVGVAACGPDPMCKEHYRGGVGAGHFFAPPESLEERLANAQLIARALNAHDELVVCLKRFAEIDYAYKPDEFTRPDSLYALVQRSLKAIALAEGR